MAWGQTADKPLFNTLRPRQNGRRFADDTSKRMFLNENVWISIKISLKFVPKGPINNNPALVQIMAWRRSGDKPLSEPMMASSPTHICVTRPQWVKTSGLVSPRICFNHTAHFDCQELTATFSLSWLVETGILCTAVSRVAVWQTNRWHMWAQTIYIQVSMIWKNKSNLKNPVQW